MFYAEYNTRLFFYLLLQQMDGLCAIDLDTIIPCLLVSKIKRVKRIYDAHEFFTEMKEVRSRSWIRRFWVFIESITVPSFQHGYTVSDGLAREYEKRYKKSYAVIRNFPVLKILDPSLQRKNCLLYQGAVNEGRGFEFLIPAIRDTGYSLVICGDGNFMNQLKNLIQQYGVQKQVTLLGMLLPDELWPIAQQATVGISLAEQDGVNQFHALPNKFLEYIHAGLPQLSMSYPEYLKINNRFRVAVLINQLSVKFIADKLEELMKSEGLRKELHHNCLEARKVLCWENEEKSLLEFYRNIF